MEKTKSVLFIIWKEAKMETIFIFSYFIVMHILKVSSLVTYFTLDRKNGIISFFAIIIGIYISVFAILSTSIIPLTEKLIKEKVLERIILLLKIGIAECFCTVIWIIFINQIKAYYFILGVLAGLSLILFIKFIILLEYFFRASRETFPKEIDSVRKYKNEVLSNFDILKKQTDIMHKRLEELQKKEK